MTKLSWPMMYFGPMNLWTVVPASWFYLSTEEKQKYAWVEQDTEPAHCSFVSFNASPISPLSEKYQRL